MSMKLDLLTAIALDRVFDIKSAAASSDPLEQNSAYAASAITMAMKTPFERRCIGIASQ